MSTAVPWHRQMIGGLWDEMGTQQFRYLVDSGLQPHHRLLDVGCGSLSGGIHFIRYLGPGKYTGVDAISALLSAGKNIELRHAGLESKTPHLVQMDDFGFGGWRQTFDYAIARSVFTHISLNSIMLGLVNIAAVLAPDGVFFATFFENDGGRAHTARILRTAPDGPFWTYFDRDPFHYDVDTLRWAAEDASLRISLPVDGGEPYV